MLLIQALAQTRAAHHDHSVPAHEAKVMAHHLVEGDFEAHRQAGAVTVFDDEGTAMFEFWLDEMPGLSVYEFH